MKALFQGKRKFISAPVLAVIGLAFLPIILGLGLGYLIFKKIGNPKVKYTALVIVAFFTLFTGSAWVAGMSSSSTNSKAIPTPTAQTAQVNANEAQTINSPEAQVSNTPVPTSSPALANLSTAKVISVTDGDTFKVSIDGKTETIRIIGIDTPETVDPRKTVQCFGKEASDKSKSLLTNQTVQLEADPTQGERDKYQRLLRYVWLDNGKTDFGKYMIAEGYAHEYTYSTPYKYQAEYKKAYTDARNGNQGLWSPSTCAGNTTSQAVLTPKPTSKSVTNQQPTTPPAQSQTTTGGGACKYSCSGPDRDCSDFSSHAEAQSFFNCCGFTAQNDPMKLDSVGVGDGVACESI